jgi:hypothetical protein
MAFVSQRDMSVITKQWDCKMKLSEKTLEAIEDKIYNDINSSVIYAQDITDILRQLSFVIQPYDSSQATLVISGETK